MVVVVVVVGAISGWIWLRFWLVPCRTSPKGSRHGGSVPEKKRAAADWPCGRKEEGNGAGMELDKNEKRERKRNTKSERRKEKEKERKRLEVLRSREEYSRVK